MKSLRIPEKVFAAHRKAHENIIRQYAELNIALMQDQQFKKSDILKMVRQWIFDHFVEYDTAVRPYLTHPSSLPLAEANKDRPR